MTKEQLENMKKSTFSNFNNTKLYNYLKRKLFLQIKLLIDQNTY